MKYKKSQDHLKFTLFPFVSILLATVGVLIFLTMIQAVLIKEEKDQEKPKEEENKRTFERIPEFNTHILRFYKDKITYLKSGEKLKTFNADNFRDISYEIIKQCVMINHKRSQNEIDKREHLLYVVDQEGVQSYFKLIEYLRLKLIELLQYRPQDAFYLNIFPKSSSLGLSLNQYLPTGLVLLNKGEGFWLK